MRQVCQSNVKYRDYASVPGERRCGLLSNYFGHLFTRGACWTKTVSTAYCYGRLQENTVAGLIMRDRDRNIRTSEGGQAGADRFLTVCE